MARPRSETSSSNRANLGFEAKLSATADARRNNMDAIRNEFSLPVRKREAAAHHVERIGLDLYAPVRPLGVCH